MIKTIEYPKNYIVWDLETSGLDPKKSKILEIGMFRVVNGEVTQQKRWVLNHGIEIPAEITAINGMTKEIIDAEGRDPNECLLEFIHEVRHSDANLTHNGIRFDIGFFVESCSGLEVDLEKMKSHLQKTSIDTAVLFKAHRAGYLRNWNESFFEYATRVMSVIIKGKYNLGVCCDELGIDRSKTTQHRALGDVELTHEVFKAMLLK